MGISPDLSTVLDPSPLIVPRSRKRRLASIVSSVFSPPLMCLAIVLYVAMTGKPHPATWRVSVYILICIILPVLYLLRMLKNGEISDFHINLRCERIKPMAVMFGSTAAGWAFLVFTRRSFDVLTLIAGVALLQYAAMFGITYYWKISAHTTASTSLALLLSMTQGSYMLPALALIPLVIWARVILRRHTLAQALAGSMLGAVFAFFILYLISKHCILRGLICIP